MGTTVATNALLERKGTKTAFVVTEGFKDLLVIGNQSRPKMFDLAINRPEILHSKVIEVRERVTLEAWTEQQRPKKIEMTTDETLIEGITGEIVRVLKPIGMLCQTRFNHIQFTYHLKMYFKPDAIWKQLTTRATAL